MAGTGGLGGTDVTDADCSTDGSCAAGRSEPRTFRAECENGVVFAGASGKSSNEAAKIRAKKNVLRMVCSSIQLADGPVGALAHGGIKIWRLAKFLQVRRGFAVAPFHQLIDQRHLYQRRLLLLQRINDGAADLRLRVGATPEGVERGEAHVHAGVIAQSVNQRGENLRVEMLFATRPGNAF